ncbi:MAG: GFA family protein [Minwuia sp.]|nr:GFA family protein [Minwuia sp.]
MPDIDQQEGGCICGGVRYRVTGSPVIVAHCHCRDCQRGGGGGHSTGAMFPVDRFRLTGPVRQYQLVSSQGTRVTRSFCPTCASPIFGRNDGAPDHVTSKRPVSLLCRA